MPRERVACADGACRQFHWTHAATRGLLTAGLPGELFREAKSSDSVASVFDTADDDDRASVRPSSKVNEIMEAARARHGSGPLWLLAEELEDVTLPAVDHLLVLTQMSRLLSGDAALKKLLLPRAFTVIAGELDGVAFKWALERALAPKLRIVDSSSTIRTAHVLMAVDLTNCNPTGERRGARSDWSDVLATQMPVILRILPGEREPDSLQLVEAVRLKLPAPDRQTLMWVMSVLYARANPAELASASKQLPVDSVLEGMATVDILAALRCPTPTCAVRALEIASQPKRLWKGPNLDELVGYGEAKDAALEIVEDLAAWGRGDLEWDEVCRGVIFHGPPGVGKTQLARALAMQQGIGFVATSYAEMQKTGHLGDMLDAMFKAFRTAVSNRPSILFIDEIEAFGRRSYSNKSNLSYDNKGISGFLQCLDGIDGREGVVVVGATNNVDALDDAIRRAGRFDREIFIAPPSMEELPFVLRHHLKGDLANSDLTDIAALAAGKSGAECEGAIRNARSKARRQKRSLTEEDLARELGAYQDNWPVPMTVATACHEAGHAIVAVALGLGKPVSIRIIQSGGVCVTDRKVQLETRRHLHHLRMLDLAGRAAERMVLGGISSGSGGSSVSDLAVATQRIIDEELSSGIGLGGPLYYGPACSLSVMDFAPDVQEHLRRRLKEAEDDAFELLIANKQVLQEITRMLLLEKVLAGEKLDSILSRVKVS